MSTTDDSERDRSTPGSPLAGNGPIRALQVSPNLLGAGCFGCSSLVFVVGCLILLFVVGMFLLPDLRANYRYVANTGVVIDKRVGSQMFDVAQPNGQGVKQQESYRPEIKIRYEVNGRKFETWCYDATGMYSPNRAAQEALLDSYQVGGTYPCWHDPDTPEKAILVRGHAWGAYVFTICPLTLIAVGVAGIWFSRLIMSNKPARGVSGEPSAEGPAPRFAQMLQSMLNPSVPIDPSRFGDPLALKTEWSPLASGSSNFQTHRLVEVDSERLVYRPTWFATVFALMFFLIGICLVGLFLVQNLANFLAGKINFNGVIILPAGFIFAAAGVYLIREFSTPVVFDRQRRIFWRGWKAPDEGFDDIPLKNAANFPSIHALQLIRMYSQYNQSYEINLVLENGDRLKVAQYAIRRQNQLREDAKTLAAFLGKPVWDAS